jgi:hypothetical protein
MQQIAVEVKSFVGKSPVHDFHEATGQFSNYRSALKFKEPERLLFLAIPDETYNDFFPAAICTTTSQRGAYQTHYF